MSYRFRKDFIFKYSKPYRLFIALFFLAVLGHSGSLVLFATLLNTLTSVLPRDVVDVTALTDEQKAASLAALMDLVKWGVPAIAGMFVFHGSSIFLRKYVTYRISVDLRRKLTSHILTLPLRFFEGKRSGDLLSRSTNDILKAERAFEIFWGEFVAPLVSLLILIPTLFYLSWKLSLITIVGLPPIVYLVRRASKKILSASEESLKWLGELTEALREIFESIKIIKAFRLEKTSEKRFFDVSQRFFRATMRAAKAFALNAGVMEGLTYFFVLTMIAAGTWLTFKGVLDMSLTTLVPFIFLLSPAYMRIKALSKSHNALQESFAAITRIEEILKAENDIKDAPDAVEIDGVRRGVEFDRVTFAYSEETVLKDVSFTIPAGRMTALVGRSGAGKTTVFNLIARFYDVDEGAVLIDGLDVRKIKHASLMDNLALVTQESILFNDTIYNNILYGRPDATREEVMAAAEAAYVTEFSRTLPGGMDYVIGERGGNLSGGQRQRITLARAMLKNAPLLLLDEATSSLDSESEKAVQDALEKLMKGRTTVVIAHRLSTIRKADKIIVLEAGRVAAVGRHEELVEKSGIYRDLCRLQELGGGDA